MAGYICPECGTDLDVKNEDVHAHAMSHWGNYKPQDLSKEGRERLEEMEAEHAKRKK